MKVVSRKSVVCYPKHKKHRKLLFPYDTYFSKGVFTNNCGRLILSITNHKGMSKSISYAKYLWEVANGRKVRKGYEIDHIDGDCTNDTLDNLQEITKEENRKKGTSYLVKRNNKNKGKLFLWCPVCGKRFKKHKCRVNLKKLKKGNEFHFCCRICQIKAQHIDYASFNIQKFKKVRVKPIKNKNRYVPFVYFSTK